MFQVPCLKCHFLSNQIELNDMGGRLSFLLMEEENKMQYDCTYWCLLNSRGEDFKLSLLSYAYISIYFAS